MPKKAKVTSGDGGMWTSKPVTSHFIDSFWFDTISTTSVLPISDTEPLLFYIPGLEKINIIMDQIWMNIKIKILQKTDGEFKAMSANNKAFPINALFYTLFEDFELSLNDEKAISSRGAYQFESYLHLLLDTTQQEKNGILTAAMYHQDKAGAHEVMHVDKPDANFGSFNRYSMIKESKIAELCGRLWCPLFSSGKPLLDKVNMAIRLYPARAKRCMIVAGLTETTARPEFQIQILSAELLCGRARLKHPTVPRALYPMKMVQTLKIPVPAGLQVVGPFEIHRGLAPSLVRVILLTEAQNEGDVMINRLKFSNHNVREITLRLGSRSLPWRTGLEMDFKASNYCQPYVALINESAQYGKDAPISYDDFDSGYTIFSFNTTTSHDQHTHPGEQEYSEQEDGSLELTCVFEKSPAKPLVFIVVCYFPSILAIDQNRKFQITDATTMSGRRSSF